MSARDRALLQKADLSIRKTADLLKKSRQTVSKGISGEKDYFRLTDLVRLNEEVVLQFPDNPGKHERLREAIDELFEDLARRLGGPASRRNLVAALAEARRVWLIFPGFAEGLVEQPEAYRCVLDALDKRKPATSFDSAVTLEIVVFCDKGRIDIESEFAPSWFSQRKFAVIECDAVEMMAPMVVVDPNREDKCSSFALTTSGFQMLAPIQAAGRVKAFASHVSDKLREPAPSRKPLNVRTASAAELLEVQLEEA
jgi:hypothetical protein